jgi:general secretion pathway protein G
LTTLCPRGNSPVACTFFPEKSTASCANGGGSPFAPRSHDQQRFTLKKIIVVVAMLGLQATLIVSKLISGPEEAKRVTANQDIGIIMQALKLYRRDNGRYPTQEQGLRALTEKPVLIRCRNSGRTAAISSVCQTIPGATCISISIRASMERSTYSAAAPMQRQGGEGEAADVGSWE